MKIEILAVFVLVSISSIGNPAAAQPQAPAPQIELYSGLLRGMTPEEASSAILKLDGVKSSKLKKQKRPEPAICVDVSHNMSKGGEYGGQKGFPYLECDSQGLKAVVVKFSDGKNAYSETVPMCLSMAISSYARLRELLQSKYKEVAHSDVNFDESFVRGARVLATKEKLEVSLGKKPLGSLDLVDSFALFTDGQRAIVLQSKVKHWSFYKTLPNMSQAMCSADEGWQAQPEIRYSSMAEWLAENERQGAANAEKDKRDADSL